jgi:uncharacterized membrane protein YbaN (DUF454 family)
MPQNNPGPDNNHVKSDLLRWILICCGWICIVAGVIGIFLPLIPTVPFLLLAVACFARSSERFHSWLVEHNYLGPLVRDYLNGTGIPLRAKRIAIGMIWVSLPASTPVRTGSLAEGPADDYRSRNYPLPAVPADESGRGTRISGGGRTKLTCYKQEINGV